MGIDLDAASRGLKVVLVEKHDLASGRSVDDLLDRRTRVGLVDTDRQRGHSMAERVLGYH